MANTGNLAECFAADLAGLQHRDDLGQDSDIGGSLHDT